MSFLGPYLNLTDCAVGGFTVESLAGRDAAGHPKWRVVCSKCGDVQVLPHKKLAPLIDSGAAQNLQCANGACKLSRSNRYSETLNDFRRQERKEANAAARRAADAQRKADAEAAKARAVAVLKREWQEYYRHQLQTNIELTEIMPFERWRQLSPGNRQIIMERLRADPTAYFTGL